MEAVYIATPHPMHADWALKAAKAGKHILCEKPLTMNHPDSARVVDAARRNRVFLMEAFMYRCHPQTARLVELIRKKCVGEVRLIQASFCFEAPVDVHHRLFNPRLGGGGILDIGCYPVSMARLIAGAVLGKPFAEPLEVKGTAVIGSKAGWMKSPSLLSSSPAASWRSFPAPSGSTGGNPGLKSTGLREA